MHCDQYRLYGPLSLSPMFPAIWPQPPHVKLGRRRTRQSRPCTQIFQVQWSRSCSR